MTLRWQGARNRARLGAGLSFRAVARTGWCTRLLALTLVAVFLITPTAAFAQDSDNTSSDGGTVRVRAVNNTETVADTTETGEYAAVVSRAMPASDSAGNQTDVAADATVAPSN